MEPSLICPVFPYPAWVGELAVKEITLNRQTLRSIDDRRPSLNGSEVRVQPSIHNKLLLASTCRA